VQTRQAKARVHLLRTPNSNDLVVTNYLAKHCVVTDPDLPEFHNWLASQLPTCRLLITQEAQDSIVGHFCLL
jgi:hypothetical protein